MILLQEPIATIRDYASTDLAALYAIALSTGDNGGDASHQFQDPELLGQVYAAPYAILEPKLALVVDDGQGVAGYCVGTLDTRAFEQRLEADWWPALRLHYPILSGEDPAEDRTDDAGIIQTIHHPPRAPDWLVAAYPSHLHINLLPRVQGRSYGGKLLDAWHRRARTLGSIGFHLGVSPLNARAIGFYEAVGLDRLVAPSQDVVKNVIWFGARDLPRR